ncbi:ubiquinol-cytochrome c reductase cytochrome b subunit [Friedmanniella luteola]|uniref:Cytochrome bc1 complex cytochrome b subunit n=1 Tax=Friedmanniella luteola TaxID=546871 RepID=A0A1H2A307_9ACTN|nr:cytochrome b N-terminal domain-containing protein [Friedmanniella luteola]SDT40314.1 ubiquinol-cytochrome c reductase cytochrome b subunit [Friedmanniella luteola]
MPTASGSRARGASDEEPLRPAFDGPLARRPAALVARLRQRAVPSHWSSWSGVVSFGCLLVLVVTGLLLALLYDPSGALVRYGGSYSLLRGVEMSRAFASTLHLSFDVSGGLLLRQAHHWAALVLPASLILQLATTFFTGAFRRPRQWSWVLLVGVLGLALVSGWSGYALPDDTLSGTGLRIVQGVTLGLPLVGTGLSWLLFGGELPGTVIPRLYVLHLAAPVLLVLLVVARARSALRHGPVQFPGPGRTEDDVVGFPAWPTAAVRAAGLLVSTVGLLVLMGATLVVSPVWRYGPSSPGHAFAGSQPDWYTAFLDGALRLVPPGWEVVWLGRTWTLAVLVPLAVIGTSSLVLASYPFLESRVTGDRRDHRLLDRPRDVPTRTALGVAGVTVYVVLWAAGSADLVATQFRVSFEGVIWTLRAALLVGPLVAGLVTRQVCATLRAADRDRVDHGVESGRILRSPDGGYEEPRDALGAAQRWTLTRAAAPAARPSPPGSGADARRG